MLYYECDIPQGVVLLNNFSYICNALRHHRRLAEHFHESVFVLSINGNQLHTFFFYVVSIAFLRVGSSSLKIRLEKVFFTLIEIIFLKCQTHYVCAESNRH